MLAHFAMLGPILIAYGFPAALITISYLMDRGF